MKIKLDKRVLKRILKCLESQAESCDCYSLHDEEQKIYDLIGRLEKAMKEAE